MNLTKLFETQAVLDEHIMQEHPELRGQDNLDWKLLALQVELGECANEWRGFKKWSKDQKPRTAFEGICECPHCDGFCSNNDDQPRNYVLEEYVDCLHFILSIGLELGANKWVKLSEYPVANENGSITLQFLDVHSKTLKVVEEIIRMESGPAEIRDLYTQAFESFLQLGTKLAFTWDEVETAYFEKNRINHARQTNGY
ncbi:dUTP diphosphatase [Lysinibacillus sp.]|uniref:dUTP diphosphatase n=1 Tax=Lysinibacillus sp. TaxID=1869345 RepID=UPI0028A58D72|nr:dUTP diphosphatase [Lysinibacillus sp.]